MVEQNSRNPDFLRGSIAMNTFRKYLFQYSNILLLEWQNEKGISINLNVQLQRGFKNYIHPAH